MASVPLVTVARPLLTVRLPLVTLSVLLTVSVLPSAKVNAATVLLSLNVPVVTLLLTKKFASSGV